MTEGIVKQLYSLSIHSDQQLHIDLTELSPNTAGEETSSQESKCKHYIHFYGLAFWSIFIGTVTNGN